MCISNVFLDWCRISNRFPSHFYKSHNHQSVAPIILDASIFSRSARLQQLLSESMINVLITLVKNSGVVVAIILTSPSHAYAQQNIVQTQMIVNQHRFVRPQQQQQVQQQQIVVNRQGSLSGYISPLGSPQPIMSPNANQHMQQMTVQQQQQPQVQQQQQPVQQQQQQQMQRRQQNVLQMQRQQMMIQQNQMQQNQMQQNQMQIQQIQSQQQQQHYIQQQVVAPMMINSQHMQRPLLYIALHLV